MGNHPQKPGEGKNPGNSRNNKESEEVKYEENDRTASYTYTDLLTRTVEVDVFNGEGYSPLLPPIVIENKRRKMKEQLVQVVLLMITFLGLLQVQVLSYY